MITRKGVLVINKFKDNLPIENVINIKATKGGDVNDSYLIISFLEEGLRGSQKDLAE